MLLCTRAHLTDLLLPAWLAACEAQNPGLAERTISDVSGEIGDMLAYRYPQPWPNVPELVRYCAAVISAYRVVQAITSLVKNESATDNEWIPLQKQYASCLKLLDDIAGGKLKLPLSEAHPDREDASIAVIARRPVFDLEGL